MHYVFYQCTSADGKESVAKTLSEAKKFVEENGGSYRIVFNRVETYSQPFIRSGARWKQ